VTDHKTGTRQEWLATRLELLEAEKPLTRRSDELARRWRELPWVLRPAQTEDSPMVRDQAASLLRIGGHHGELGSERAQRLQRQDR